MIALVLLIIAGAIDGIVEGYEFDGRKSFERKFKVKPKGFFGSHSWQKRYTKPNIWNILLGVWDFYHLADDLRKALYIGGGMLAVLSDYRFDTIIVFIAAFIISGIPKRLGMHWIRN